MSVSPHLKELALAAGGVVAGSLLTAAWLRRTTSDASSAQCQDTDDAYMALAHASRAALQHRPSQSLFRVTAVVVFRVDGALRHVIGHNDEACCLLNSVCAVRAARSELPAFRHPSCKPLRVQPTEADATIEGWRIVRIAAATNPCVGRSARHCCSS